jgi:hypothetical protein
LELIFDPGLFLRKSVLIRSVQNAIDELFAMVTGRTTGYFSGSAGTGAVSAQSGDTVAEITTGIRDAVRTGVGYWAAVQSAARDTFAEYSAS